MKIILLKTGQECFVDDEDYKTLSEYEWRMNKGGYAYRNQEGNRVMLMHRQILGLKRGQITDHEDRNKLNNRRYNIRPATHKQNHGNVWHTKAGMSSKFKGVYWHSKGKKWAAQLHQTIDGKARSKHLGLFTYEVEAARAYNKAAVEHFGTEFALLNPV